MQLQSFKIASIVIITGFVLLSAIHSKQADEYKSIENGSIQKQNLQEDSTVIDVDISYRTSLFLYTYHLP
jgi:hypothetical protein